MGAGDAGNLVEMLFDEQGQVFPVAAHDLYHEVVFTGNHNEVTDFGKSGDGRGRVS